MAVELVTGYAGKEHVSSSEDGARQAGTVGTGMYALETVDEPLKATLENANTVTVGPGDVLINGRHVQLTGSTTFAIPVGTQGQRTSNLLVIRYEVAEGGTESATAITLTGSPSTEEPEDPELTTGDILEGDSPVDMPLYRVVTTGIETAEPVALFETIPPIASLPGVFGNVLDAAHGGTGQTSLQATRNAMGLGNTLGALPVANGGTGMTSSPSMLVNLGSTSAASVFQASPRPGVTGTLPVSRGGTGVTSDSGIGLKAYPIGAIYTSWVSTSPASLFGGSWMQLNGAFPKFGSGTSTGGSNSHTLTVNEMPSHNHTFHNRSSGAAQATIITADKSAGRASGSLFSPAGTIFEVSINNTGGSSSFSTQPYYQTIYAWRRTA